MCHGPSRGSRTCSRCSTLGTPEAPAPILQHVELAQPETFLDLTLRGIESMAEAGIVHSDLSPFNILVHSEEPWFIDLAAGLRVDRLGASPWIQLTRARESLDHGLAVLNRYFRRYRLEFDGKEVLERLSRQWGIGSGSWSRSRAFGPEKGPLYLMTGRDPDVMMGPGRMLPRAAPTRRRGRRSSTEWSSRELSRGRRRFGAAHRRVPGSTDRDRRSTATSAATAPTTVTTWSGPARPVAGDDVWGVGITVSSVAFDRALKPVASVTFAETL